NNLKGELATGWYVPTVTEFTVIYNNMSDIHDAIASMNKEVSLYETALWTSSQCSTDPTKVYAISTTNVSLANKTYLAGGHILVIHTFGKAIEEPKTTKKEEKKKVEKEQPKEEKPVEETPKEPEAKPQSFSELILTVTSRPAAKTDYSALDKEVKALRFTSNDKIADVAKKITSSSQTTKQKARALYTWISTNVRFDKDGNKESENVKGIWKTGMATEKGYSLLFKQMAKDAGIKADSVEGDVKNVSGKHFWNVVYDGKTVIVVDIPNGNFDIDPALFIFSHFPKSSKAQGVEKAVKKDLFEKLPNLTLNFEGLGVNAKDVLTFYQTHKNAGFPEINQIKEVADTGLKINKLPMTKTLGKEGYTFNFEFPQGVSVQLVTPKGNQKITSGKDLVYSANASGSVKVNVTKSGKTYTLFTYESKVE
ncbi:MAG: hypothetical protein J6S91_13405, partial [Treponema sp.]|nr:hypothetical protein [Treponema sp.]